MDAITTISSGHCHVMASGFGTVSSVLVRYSNGPASCNFWMCFIPFPLAKESYIGFKSQLSCERFDLSTYNDEFGEQIRKIIVGL